MAAEYAGVAIEVPHFRMGQDNRTDWFLAMNPNGKVPVLETEDDAFFESNAIARYVARVGDSNGLLGKTLMERAQIEQWIDFSSSEASAAAAQLLRPGPVSESPASPA